MNSTPKTRMARIWVVSLLICAGLFAFPVHTVHAADFHIIVDRTFSVIDEDHMHIKEARILTNNSSRYYIPAHSQETFVIQNFKEEADTSEIEYKTSSVTVTDERGIELEYATTIENGDITISVPYSTAVSYGSTRVFILEYDTTELVEHVGNITNIYIPGLEKSYTQTTEDTSTGTTTDIVYTTTLEVPDTLEPHSFTLPQPSSTSETNGKTIYTFSTDSILGRSVWHQIGTEQIYSFTITQPVPKTDTTTPTQLSFLSQSEYTLLLPRDYSKTHQHVYFSDITPAPTRVSLDADGNVQATFYLDATTDTRIVINGYIITSVDTGETAEIDKIAPTINDIAAFPDMAQYLLPAPYWETDAPAIAAKAAEIMEGNTSILEILRADYEYIVDSIDYDNFKFGNRNTRQGALVTLKGGSSVCMEYADLLIALARAQGIPARAAYGYGYDPTTREDSQEEHQWAQAWIPGYGWLTLDPTWGETGREFIGQDLDHALWYVASKNPDTPSPLEVRTAETDFDLEQSTIRITAIDSMPPISTLTTADDLVFSTHDSSSTIIRISRAIQTTMAGRMLVTLLPIFVIAIVAVSILNVAVRILFKKPPRKRNTSESPPRNPSSSQPAF